jgi:opacity protein-like surface antigen
MKLRRTQAIMKKLVSLVALMAATLAAAQPAAIAGGIGNNTIGPSVSFGGSQSVFGIDGKFGIADNLSIRPFVAFPTGGTSFGGSLTYDFDLRQSATPITPFLGVGVDVSNGGGNSITTGFVQAGADFNVSDNFSLLGAVAIPFNSQNTNTSVTVGAGLRF